MTAPALETLIVALLEGLELDAGDITPSARRSLERVARELLTLEAPNLEVLRRSRRLYLSLRPESELLRLSSLATMYPELSRVYRKSESRRLRDERERLERHALYASPARVELQ